MKTTTNKKIGVIRAIALSLTLLMVLLTLASCGGRVSSKGTLTLVLGTEEEAVIKIDLGEVSGDRGLISVLDYLKTEERLTYKADASGFLTEVGPIKQDAANGTYIYIWTSVEADFDVSEYATTKEFDGKTLTSSGVGASEMTIEDGAIIYIGTVEWQ